MFLPHVSGEKSNAAVNIHAWGNYVYVYIHNN